MKRPIIKEVNVTTGEEIERKMNDEEFAQYQTDQAAEIERLAEIDAMANSKAELLDRLGITAEEAKLLLAE